MSIRTNLRLTSLVAVLGAWLLAALLLLRDEDEQVPYTRMVSETVSTDHLERAEGVRFYFGHNSVGMNVLDAVPDVYADRGLVPPRITDLSAGGEAGGDGIEHAYIGVNGDPLGKLEDFDARMRSGIGDRVDVALMKFCYVDITSETDVDALFAAYRDTLEQLQRDYPDVVFLHATVPLSTDPGWKSRVKRVLGRDDHMGPADNAARQRFNALVRDAYPAGRVYDIAAIESTEPDGSRSSGTSDGQTYYALYGGYAADPGHLNEAGAEIAAAHLLDLVGGVVARHP